MFFKIISMFAPPRNCNWFFKITILLGLVFLLSVENLYALTWYGHVIKIIDGDSLLVKREGAIYEIRLYGIDAPEYGQSFSDRAKGFARQQVYRKVVSVKQMDEDKYGRIVALVRGQGKLLNREMVRAGMAWVYPKYCKDKPLCDELKNLEKKARKSKRGLWRVNDPISPWQWKYQKRKKSR